MKKMDLGEFTKFCKDFSINLHKVKLTEIFRKIHPHYLEHKQFKEVLIPLSEEFTRNKLIEHRERLREISDLIDQLELPEQYENKYKDKGAYDNISAALDKKAEKYRKYITNELRQNNHLSEQKFDVRTEEHKEQLRKRTINAKRAAEKKKADGEDEGTKLKDDYGDDEGQSENKSALIRPRATGKVQSGHWSKYFEKQEEEKEMEKLIEEENRKVEEARAAAKGQKKGGKAEDEQDE